MPQKSILTKKVFKCNILNHKLQTIKSTRLLLNSLKQISLNTRLKNSVLKSNNLKKQTDEISLI